ncbi:MAG: L-idonate 5-dehydrogenase [Hyphomicrobiales bacterium]|nr:L-idonate 5-dehydrogenase [Hyphomicrobiales bacterium]
MDTRVCRLYGKNDLRVEIDTISKPGPDEVVVATAFGGICGSDLHYLLNGGMGATRVREPVILGHEASGRIIEVGADVSNLSPGCNIAINPSRPCYFCEFCRTDLEMHCPDMKFSGSAIRLPHEQGLFRDFQILKAEQCIQLDSGADLSAVACAEPLAVCIHAASIAGELNDKRILVTGAGPIGALCTAVAARAGAREIIVTDIQDATLKVVKRMGATHTINVASNSGELDKFASGQGYFDVAFECSAAQPAMYASIRAMRPRGTIVQVGVAGDTLLPVDAIVGREVRLLGTHRFHKEFEKSVAEIVSGRIDVRPIITEAFPVEHVNEAFRVANDRSKSVKVHLEFKGTH